jgi:hypothetical protein
VIAYIPSYTSRGTPVILDVNEAGNAQVVFEGSPSTDLAFMIQSPDGRHAILEVPTPGDNNVWMVENF